MKNREIIYISIDKFIFNNDEKESMSFIMKKFDKRIPNILMNMKTVDMVFYIGKSGRKAVSIRNAFIISYQNFGLDWFGTFISRRKRT